MHPLKWLAAVHILLLMLAGATSAQEARRRTLLATPNQPVEKAPKILVHKDIPTALVFEDTPKSVQFEKAEGRITLHQDGKVITLLPSVELGNRERLILTVTAPDGARFVFGVEDGFNWVVDSQVIVQRGRASLEPGPADCFVSFILTHDREELKEITFRNERHDNPSLQVEGAVTALGFAIVLVDLPFEQSQPPRVHVHGEASGDLDVVGVRQDERGLLVAVKRPAGEVDGTYTLEVESGGTPLVNRQVTLWPIATAQRTTK